MLSDISHSIRHMANGLQTNGLAQLNPAGQEVQESAPAELYCPGAHANGSDAEVGHWKPAGHAMQAILLMV